MMRFQALGTLVIGAVLLTACQGEEKPVVEEKKSLPSIQALSLYSGETLDRVLNNALLPDADSNLFTTPANVKIRSDRMPEKALDDSTLFVLDRHGHWGGSNEFQIISMQNSASPAYSGRVEFDVASAGFGVSGSSNGPTWRPGIYAVLTDGVATDVAVVDYLPAKNARVQIFDVTDTQSPKKSWEVKIDGDWKGTQQVANTLYVWSEYTVDPVKRSELQKNAGSFSQSTEMALEDTNIMPLYTMDNVTKPLTDDCLLPTSISGTEAYVHLINVTAINLQDKTVNSTCLGGESNSFSVSSDAAYVTNSYIDPETGTARTVIHKFKLTDTGLKYSSTGDVPGIFSRFNKPYATERDLRVVTSTTDDAYQLYILDEADGVLQVVSEPLSEESFDLGVVSRVQYHDDRVYIAVGVGSGGFLSDTFADEDVVYSIDLTDRTKPVLLQRMTTSTEPEIFPLNKRYVFTLGFLYEKVDGQLKNSGIGVSLLDVENESADAIVTIPVGDDNIEPTGADTYNFFRVSDDVVRVTFPSGYVSDEGGFIYGYQMLEIKGLSTDAPTMVDAGLLVLSGIEWGVSVNTTVEGDDVIIYNGGIWTATWGQPDTIEGPILRVTGGEKH